ncbi:GNAT family N-acetyltransferase [Brachybacterium endophyticum]|uniref:GNAT family N-acetyltransferase n=1 Tax=Brachybacterium endophyticum TaxID=2182385 RepID=A0A2U2RJ34_9MICO|nr:GNAT family N-acetyltransferase [Brachybacterium endophyticum]PWH05870.1 GNAT family N-acetyltransferase [Brachybacterium endophyticum]
MSIRIRRAVTADLPAVRFVGVAVWPPTYGAVKGAQYVMGGIDSYWNAEEIGAGIAAGRIDVAEDSGRVIGMTEVDELHDDLVLWKLYVLPSEQGSGVGHALVGSAKERARSHGCDLLTEYDPQNSRAATFYAREGFIATEPPWSGNAAVWLRWRPDVQHRPSGRLWT